MMRVWGLRIGAIAVSVFATVACGGRDQNPEPAAAANGDPESETATPEEPVHVEMACAQVIVVSHDEAEPRPPDITRNADEARERAHTLRVRLEGGEDFASIARAESDASSSGPRGGLIGTYGRDEWPPQHNAIRSAVFELSEGQVSDILNAPYGYVLARRCPVEMAHTRHILIRYAGARNAGDDVTRTREQARSEAEELRARVEREGADFAALARERSEDGSAENGGDLGSLGRGRLSPPYEQAAFALSPEQISDVVESPFGFHIIQRLAEP